MSTEIYLKKKIKRENMEKIDTILSKEKKQNLKEYQKNYFEANESKSLNKKMHDYDHNKLFILLDSFLISLCNVLAQ